MIYLILYWIYFCVFVFYPVTFQEDHSGYYYCVSMMVEVIYN